MSNSKDKAATTWEVLSKIDCAAHVEKKNGLTYLSWAWAWGITKQYFPDANYAVKEYDGKPYLTDEHLGYMVQTVVTIQGESIQMHLPVLDYNNKAKKIGSATMFDINTAIMRCLTKNIAMFGLGHYIYAGEDLPVQDEPVVVEPKKQPEEKPLKKVLTATMLDSFVKAIADSGKYDEAKVLAAYEITGPQLEQLRKAHQQATASNEYLVNEII